RNDRICALSPTKCCILFDAIERHFGRPPENRKHRAVLQEGDCIIAPLAGCDFSSIQFEDSHQLTTIESYLGRRFRTGRLGRSASSASRKRYWFDIAHGASWYTWLPDRDFMFAPVLRTRKTLIDRLETRPSNAHAVVKKIIISPDFGPGHAQAARKVSGS